MKGFRVDDLPPEYQRQVWAKLKVSPLPATVEPDQAKSKGRKAKGPNKTETEYARVYLAGKDVRFEALTFHLAAGYSYTPDWVVFEEGNPVSCHEVKGSYRFHSHTAARNRWKQCRIEFPGLVWVWATKSKDGWMVTNA